MALAKAVSTDFFVWYTKRFGGLIKYLDGVKAGVIEVDNEKYEIEAAHIRTKDIVTFPHYKYDIK